jgi:UPF0755 protein
LLSTGGIFYLYTYLNETVSYPQIVYVPKGSTLSSLKALKKQNVPVEEHDLYILRFIGYPQQGWIDLKSTTSSKEKLLRKLTFSKAALKSIVLIPGETTFIFCKQLANKFKLNSSILYKEFLKQTPLKEGYLVAETYNLPIGVDEKTLITALINQSTRWHKQNSKLLLKRYDQKEWFKYLVKASIIQKESANKKEMPIVSSVIDNRLALRMLLQMDGTLNYGKYSHQKVTARRIREDSTSFNTYKYKGLPKYPVCAVSFSAIKASINPIKSNYLYFFRNRQGLHDFTHSYNEHLKNIRRY